VQEYDAYEQFRSETLKMVLKASASDSPQLRSEGAHHSLHHFPCTNAIYYESEAWE
jgi:hypothetical protein